MRDWNQSYIGNFYSRDRGYASLSYFFSTRVRSTAQISASYLSFPSTTFESGAFRDSEFSTIAIGSTLFVEYLPTKHFGIFTSGTYVGQLTDKELRVNENDPLITDSLAFSRFNLALGLRYLL
jgi:hypothetical protein